MHYAHDLAKCLKSASYLNYEYSVTQNYCHCFPCKGFDLIYKLIETLYLYNIKNKVWIHIFSRKKKFKKLLEKHDVDVMGQYLADSRYRMLTFTFKNILYTYM